MPLDRGLVGAHIDLLRVLELINHRILDIDGDIDEHRPSAACVGDVESLLKNPGDIVYILDQIAVFDKGLHRAGNVCLLKGIAAQQIRMYLPGDAHQRNAVRKSGGDTGDHIGGTGAAGDGTDTGFS